MTKPKVRAKKNTRARVEVMTITPEQATALLNVNTANRPLRQGHLDSLTRAQREGRWHLTNDAIAVTGLSLEDPGLVLNGQHRLYACVESDVAIEVLVLFGADQDSFTVLDSGIKRQARDAIHESHAAAKAAVARIVLGYERNLVTTKTTHGGSAATNDEVVHCFRERPTIRRVVETYTLGLKKLVRSPVGVLAAAAVFFSVDEKAGHAFLTSLIDGAGLAAGPVLALRNRIIADSARGRANAPAMFVLTLKAWNQHRSGASVARAQLRDDDRAPPVVGYSHNPGTR